MLLLPHHPVLMETSSQQALGLHLVEVPSLLTAPNSTNDESHPGTDSSILLTRTQGPQNKKWKTSVGNTVAIIHEETSPAIWRHVPFVMLDNNPRERTKL
jgi:hypothetical protein